jgi:hypothetical protein
MPSIINATTTTGLVTNADNSGSLQLATNNGTTAVTIDTSQNVGIGTATPTFASGGGLQIRNAGFASVRVSGASSTGVDFAQATDGLGFMYNRDNNGLVFGTNNTERMRITSNGTLQQTINPVFFNIDASPCTATITNGSSINFGNAYSGAIFVTDTSITGLTALLMCGGGSTFTTGSTSFTNTSGSGTFRFYNSGAGYVLQNNSGSTATFGLFVVRTRAGT